MVNKRILQAGFILSIFGLMLAIGLYPENRYQTSNKFLSQYNGDTVFVIDYSQIKHKETQNEFYYKDRYERINRIISEYNYKKSKEKSSSSKNCIWSDWGISISKMLFLTAKSDYKKYRKDCLD